MTVALLLALFATCGLAATQSEKEFYELRARRDKELAQAAAPVNARYTMNLEALMRRALQGGDLDTAQLIKAELERFQPQADTRKKPDIVDNFAGTKWTWHSKPGGDSAYATLTLLPGGGIDRPDKMRWAVKWEQAGRNRFKIFFHDDTFWLFDYDSTKGEARSVKEKGSKSDDKLMRLMREPQGAGGKP